MLPQYADTLTDILKTGVIRDSVPLI
jgi:hypothetical protein